MAEGFPNRDKYHVFECDRGHCFECGDADHHSESSIGLKCEWHGCKAQVTKVSCPPGCQHAPPCRHPAVIDTFPARCASCGAEM